MKRTICSYFSTRTGCKNGNQCKFIHDHLHDHQQENFDKRPRTDEDKNRKKSGVSTDSLRRITEFIKIPKEQLKFVIGRGGSNLQALSTDYGKAVIKIPDTGGGVPHTDANGMVKITITASIPTFVDIVKRLKDIFKSTHCQYDFLNETLRRYENSNFRDSPDIVEIIEPHVVRHYEGETSKGKALLDKPSTSSSASGQIPGKPPPLMEVITVVEPSRLENNVVVGGRSGWGPMIDLTHPEASTNIREDYYVNDYSQQNAKSPTHESLELQANFGRALPAIQHQPQLLEEKSGYFNLSQHEVKRDYRPRHGDHIGAMFASQGDFVTFITNCAKCPKSCGYSNFRNAVGMIGVLPLDIICDTIIKFECPYCDEVVEFYQEKEYLEHVCRVHFWRRLNGFLNDKRPFRCPLKSCSYEGKTFDDLVFHYGAVPHRKVNELILDSVGERVKNLKNSSNAGNESNQLRLELDVKNSVIQSLEKELKRLQQSENNSQDLRRSGDDNLHKSGFEIIKQKCKVLEQKLIYYQTKGSEKDDFRRLLGDHEKEIIENKKVISQLQESQKAKKTTINEQDAIIQQQDIKVRELNLKVSELEKQLTELRDHPVIELNDEGSDNQRVRDLERELDDLRKQARLKDTDLTALAAKVKNLTGQLAEAQRRMGGPVLSEHEKDATIEKLRKTVKSQKAMLELKQKEIDLIQEQLNENE